MGCQLSGIGMADVNKDGLHDVTGSRQALNRIKEIAPEGFKLIITSNYLIS
jgi:hypothetical protein